VQEHVDLDELRCKTKVAQRALGPRFAGRSCGSAMQVFLAKLCPMTHVADHRSLRVSMLKIALAVSFVVSRSSGWHHWFLLSAVIA
jgi:hypothetical protein